MCVYGNAEDLDNDQPTEPSASERHESDDEDLDNTMGDGKPDIDMEVTPEPTLAPVTKTKTKALAGAKGKKKATMPELRDQIRANRKEVPNEEIGLRVCR